MHLYGSVFYSHIFTLLTHHEKLWPREYTKNNHNSLNIRDAAYATLYHLSTTLTYGYALL